MIYTKLTKKAMNIAYDAHKDVYGKEGVPYIFHPFHLAEQMNEEYPCVVALLHDVVEDTEVTFEQLESEFPQEVIDALKLLTHDKTVDYLEYVKKIKENPIAKQVKLADLKHNSDLTRIDNIEENDLKRVEKYKKALDILNS